MVGGDVLVVNPPPAFGAKLDGDPVVDFGCPGVVVCPKLLVPGKGGGFAVLGCI
jgi:hypothetical protein